MNPSRIGLALSGGGARGLAHIGILKVFEKAAIPIGSIGGTSMGGVIGALYAAGWHPEQIEHAALGISKPSELIRLADLTGIKRGLFEGHRIRSMIESWLQGINSFEKLRIPLALCAVDLNTSKEVVMRSGNLISAIMATTAFPGVFPPVNIGDYRLVDGGLLNNLPVDRVRELGADKVIAVDVLFQVCDVSSGWRMTVPVPGIFEEMYRAEMIVQAEYSRVKLSLTRPDILITPPIPSYIGFFIGFANAKKIIAGGEIAASQALPLIKTLLKRD